jgi:hypothetical protein
MEVLMQAIQADVAVYSDGGGNTGGDGGGDRDGDGGDNRGVGARPIEDAITSEIEAVIPCWDGQR